MQLTVTPENGLVDEPLAIRADGLRPFTVATVRLLARDMLDRRWESAVAVLADEGGRIDLTTDEPLRGSYSGADPTGLLWSMQPLDQPEIPVFVNPVLAPSTCTVTLEVDDEVVAERQVVRQVIGDGVQRIAVEEDVRGTLFLPAGEGPHPAVLVLGGSGGAVMEEQAAVLAGHGFAAFALAYYAAPGLPEQLVRVPIEYVEQAVAWLRKHEAVRPDRVAVTGTSRGGELSLLLASRLGEPTAVVAWVPSAFVHSGVHLTLDEGSGGIAEAPAWTAGGEPLPFLAPSGEPPAFASVDGQRCLTFAPEYLRQAEAAGPDSDAAIPVERIQGPVLVVSAGRDLTWPSERFGDLVVERLRKNGHPYRVEHLSYPEAGHLLGWMVPNDPLHLHAATDPASGITMLLGGSDAADAAARADAWPRAVAFLREWATS